MTNTTIHQAYQVGEFLLVNTVAASLMGSWDKLGGLQTILILSAIIFNIVRVYGWFEKRSAARKAAKELRKRRGED